MRHFTDDCEYDYYKEDALPDESSYDSKDEEYLPYDEAEDVCDLTEKTKTTSSDENGTNGFYLRKPVRNTEQELDYKQIMLDYRSNDPKKVDAAMTLVMNDLGGLIYHIIKKTYSRYASKYFEDLVQQGYLGISKGMQSYDPEASKPSTYFYYYILHEIQDFINVNVSKTSSYYSAGMKKVKPILEKYKEEDKPFSKTDLAIQANLPLETIEKIIKIINTSETSLDAAPTDYLETHIIDADTQSPEEWYAEKEKTEILESVIKSILTPEEIKMIEMYYGIHSVETRSLKAIAKELGIPTDRAKKQMSRILFKLRNSRLKEIACDSFKANELLVNDENAIQILPKENIDMAVEELKTIDVSF